MVEELVRPGTTVWDVGANVGLFSFCAAGLSGPSGFVLSVEPDLWLAQLLGRSSQELSRSQSTCSCVQVLCASISDSSRVTELSVSERARSSNHLVHASGSSQAQGSRYNQLTVSLTLDSLLEHFPPPSVLKIDVETHEANVLRGATRLLREVRPAVWCEVSQENSDEVTSLLHEAGYQLYGAATQPHMRTERAWFDTLGIPIESCAF
jgi:FkbM family methyltransferase